MSEKAWAAYLSGAIHGDWRERIARGVEAAGLPVRLSAPVTVHEDSSDRAAAARAVARDPAQVVQALAYVTRGELPR